MKTIILTESNSSFLDKDMIRLDDIKDSSSLSLPVKVRADFLVHMVKKFDAKPSDKLIVEGYDTWEGRWREILFSLWHSVLPRNAFSQLERVEVLFERRLGIGISSLLKGINPHFDLRGDRFWQRIGKKEEFFRQKYVRIFMEGLQDLYKTYGLVGAVDAITGWRKRLAKDLEEKYFQTQGESLCKCGEDLSIGHGRFGLYLICPRGHTLPLAKRLDSLCVKCFGPTEIRVGPGYQPLEVCHNYPKCNSLQTLHFET